MSEKQQLEAIKLLARAQHVLSNHWFADEDETNKEDVIECDKAIQTFLEEVK